MIIQPAETQTPAGTSQLSALPYVAPFVVFIAFLAVDRFFPINIGAIYALRFAVVFAVLITVSRWVIPRNVVYPLSSMLVGILVCAIWVAPDVLWPSYRQSWLFNNSLTGNPQSSLPAGVVTSIWFLLFRVLGSVVNVPLLEELFWRGWLMRWFIGKDFRKIPLGTYSPQSFWLVAMLFASEHGAYWDVGLLTGVVYNWWLVRTKSLGDCILCHAVTNACLAGWVLVRGQWQYWL
ncbi:MAG: CAAX prenyl protease-related protein [Acidobacteria bacterium]|nr:MAG: CAAX prenyl protease-related protein [Acidobacteriota bacterium]